MSFSRFFLFSAFAVISANADVINTVHCTTAAVNEIGTDSCAAPLQNLAGGQTGFAYADATAVYAMPVDAIAWFASTLKDFTMVNEGWVNQGLSEASASASTSLSLNLETAGPIRPGYVELQFPETNFNGNWESAAGDNRGSYSFSMGGISIRCAAGDYLMASNCSFSDQHGDFYDFYLNNATLFPWILGTAFTMNINQQSFAYSDQGLGETGATTELLFKFIEEDGVTPVALSAAPESGTMSLLALPLILFALTRAKYLKVLR